MTGEDRIRNYINRAFSGAPQTEIVLEAKESLEANLMEKYQELLKQGNTPEAAYQTVIGTVGDIFEIVDSAAEGDFDPDMDNWEMEKEEGRELEFAPDGSVENLPFIGAGVCLVFFLLSYFLPIGPRIRHFLPMVVLAAGAAVILYLFYARNSAYSNRNTLQKPDKLVAVIWAAAFLLFLLSINTRRLERITWLIPIAALACHQIAVLWRASCDLKKGEEDSNE